MAELLERLKTILADRYEIESEIGRGGMAAVYLAEDLKHRRKVAIKVLHPELASTLGSERFLQEIEIVAGLQHPHILPLHDSGEADGLLYHSCDFGPTNAAACQTLPPGRALPRTGTGDSPVILG